MLQGTFFEIKTITWVMKEEQTSYRKQILFPQAQDIVTNLFLTLFKLFMPEHFIPHICPILYCYNSLQVAALPQLFFPIYLIKFSHSATLAQQCYKQPTVDLEIISCSAYSLNSITMETVQYRRGSVPRRLTSSEWSSLRQVSEEEGGEEEEKKTKKKRRRRRKEEEKEKKQTKKR